MVKRSRQSCIIKGCGTTVREGLKVCSNHEHVAALQAELERQYASTPQGAWAILRFPPLRDLFETLVDLDKRATPLKGANTEVVSRERSHNLGDNIAVLGDNMATLAQGASTYRDRGRLGAAIAEVEKTASKVKQIADPRSGPTTQRCRSRGCPEPNRRQSLEARYCAYCGRQFKKKTR